MKQVSKWMVMVMLIAVMAAFAFRPAESKLAGVKAAYSWYLLKASGNQNSAADYMKLSAQPTCPGGANVCAVYAQDNGASHPAGIPASGPVTPNSFIQTVTKRN